MNYMQEWYKREVARIGLMQTIQTEIPEIPGYARVIALKSDGKVVPYILDERRCAKPDEMVHINGNPYIRVRLLNS